MIAQVDALRRRPPFVQDVHVAHALGIDPVIVLAETDEWRRAARLAAAREISETLAQQRREASAKARKK